MVNIYGPDGRYLGTNWRLYNQKNYARTALRHSRESEAIHPELVPLTEAMAAVTEEVFDPDKGPISIEQFETLCAPAAKALETLKLLRLDYQLYLSEWLEEIATNERLPSYTHIKRINADLPEIKAQWPDFGSELEKVIGEIGTGSTFSANQKSSVTRAIQFIREANVVEKQWPGLVDALHYSSTRLDNMRPPMEPHMEIIQTAMHEIKKNRPLLQEYPGIVPVMQEALQALTPSQVLQPEALERIHALAQTAHEMTDAAHKVAYWAGTVAEAVWSHRGLLIDDPQDKEPLVDAAQTKNLAKLIDNIRHYTDK